MPSVRLPSLLGLMLLVVCVACSGDEDGDPTPEASATGQPEGAGASPTPASEPSTVPTSPPSPTPLPVDVTGPVPKTVWLIDAGGGEPKTLFESYGDASAHAAFTEDGDGVLLTEGGVTVEYGLDGSRIGPVFQPEPCQFKAEGEQIDGQWHPTFQCESLPGAGNPSLSPDAEWFIYQVQDAPAASGAVPPPYAMWALSLRTNERRLLQDDMQDCGGCDSRYGPGWSASGRFLYFAETGGDGRVFLTDFEMNTTRVLTIGHQLQDSPDWSPDADVLLFRSPPGATIHYDLTTDTQRVLDEMPWPARFDATGSVIYAPAFELPAQQQPRTVTTVRLADLVATLRLDGVPEYLGVFRELNPVVGRPSVVAALSGAPRCDGIEVYANGVAPNCIEGGEGATLSPDGSMLAVSRVTGVTGQVSFPGGAGVGLNVYEVLMVDVATGAERVLADRAVGLKAPGITWSPDCTHLLVQWPLIAGP